MMINARSRGTTFGMKRWYATRVPSCSICKVKKCVSGQYRKYKICSKCFIELTGHNINEIFNAAFKNAFDWATVYTRMRQYIDAFRHTPVQVEDGEYWYMGCFIQKQSRDGHPELSPYIIFKDNEEQVLVGTASDLQSSKQIAAKNKNTNYREGLESLLWGIEVGHKVYIGK